MMQKIMENISKNKDDTKIKQTDKIKQSTKKIIEELSPKSRKIKEHIMKRNQSNDNFMKFSWSWTL
tara:strand:- start:1237 stop:1434 length:198 start_codon:yes stop_codon:yes gene_type:complete